MVGISEYLKSRESEDSLLAECFSVHRAKNQRWNSEAFKRQMEPLVEEELKARDS